MFAYLENLSLQQKIGTFFVLMVLLLIGNYLVLTYSYSIYDRHLTYSRACQQNSVDIEKFALNLREHTDDGKINDNLLQNELFILNHNINIIGKKGSFFDDKQEFFLEKDKKIDNELSDIRYQWKQIYDLTNLILKRPAKKDSVFKVLNPLDQKTWIETKISLPDPFIFMKKKDALKKVEKLVNLNEKYVHYIYVQLAEDKAYLFYIISFIVIFNISVLIIGYFAIAGITIKPLIKIAKTTTLLAKGEFASPLKKHTNDEVGSLMERINELSLSLKNISEFANNIGQGNLESDFKVRSREDELGIALLNMRESLKKTQDQEKINDWTNRGFALFGEILRNNQSDLQIFSYQVISELIKYVHANQGGLFILEKNEGEEFLELKAACAYNKRKYLEKRVKIGQGLLGQSILEKHSIHLTEVPQNYVHITSGLGEATPNTLLIVPLKTDQQIYGAVEIATFHAFKDYEIAFIEKVCENIASTLANVLNTQKIQFLLEESQEYTEQMRAQEEEMMQNMEEMTSIQEGIQTVQAQMKEKEKNLTQLINSTQDYIILTDKSYNIKVVNEAYVKMFAKTQRTVAEGMNLLEIMTVPELDFWKPKYDLAMQGKTQVEVIKSGKISETIYYEAVISPIWDNSEVVGVAMFSQDITRMKNMNWE